MPNDSKIRLTAENDPQRFSSYLKKYRTPTADEEALQAPAIDPILALTAGVGGGYLDLEAEIDRRVAGAAEGKFLNTLLGSRSLGPGRGLPIPLDRQLDIVARGVGHYSPQSAYLQLLNSYVHPTHPVLDQYSTLPVGNPRSWQSLLITAAEKAKDIGTRVPEP